MGLAVVATIAALAAGCASDMKSGDAKMSEAKPSAANPIDTKPMPTRESPEEIVAARQRLMKLNGAVWNEIQAKAKAGNLDGVAVGAEQLALNAERIPYLFPAGSMTDKSKAKPEIWQQWPEFRADAKKFETESEKLRDAARAKNAQLTEDIVKNFGREACGTCHTPFRVPPPRSS
jgi:cytochrome c556